MVESFPPGFLWGAATAGHQIEGDNTSSDTWFAEHVTPTVFREPSGPACDGYRRWREDVDLVAGMGLTAYRFSVEWARVEPREGEFDDQALARGGDVVLELVDVVVDLVVELGVQVELQRGHPLLRRHLTVEVADADAPHAQAPGQLDRHRRLAPAQVAIEND